MAQRTADIHFKDQRAGLLQETARGGTRFAYDPAWQRPIACCFPVDRREHEWAAGLHPFFQHLGTEGWLREQQARVAHIDQDDDLGLLLRYGADCIGAVSVHRPAGTPAPAPIAEATASPGRTVSGVQRKLLVTRSADGKAFVPAGPAGPAPFIAKFNSERLPTLVRNERLALAWTAAVLGKREVTEFTVGGHEPEHARGRRAGCGQVGGEPGRWLHHGPDRGRRIGRCLCRSRGGDPRGDTAGKVETGEEQRPVVRNRRRIGEVALVHRLDVGGVGARNGVARDGHV